MPKLPFFGSKLSEQGWHIFRSIGKILYFSLGPFRASVAMRNTFLLLLACLGPVRNHLAAPMPLEENLNLTTSTKSPQNLTGNDSLHHFVGQREKEKGDSVSTGKELNRTEHRVGKEKGATQWTWPKMHWRDGRKGKSGLSVGESPTIRIKNPLWVEGESRILVEADIQPPIPIITQWTLSYTQVLAQMFFFLSPLLSY